MLHQLTGICAECGPTMGCRYLSWLWPKNKSSPFRPPSRRYTSTLLRRHQSSWRNGKRIERFLLDDIEKNNSSCRLRRLLIANIFHPEILRGDGLKVWLEGPIWMEWVRCSFRVRVGLFRFVARFNKLAILARVDVGGTFFPGASYVCWKLNFSYCAHQLFGIAVDAIAHSKLCF